MVHPMVDRATSDMLIGADWAMNIEICDMLNHDPGQTKDVIKGVKRRLGHKNPKIQHLALTLLETLIKNCGDIVHMHVAERDILHEMVKIVKKKPDMHVREKILTLIDTWQEAFGGPRARYPQYYAAYQELLRSGAVFPQRSERAAPIFTPPQTQPLSHYPPQSLNNADYQQEAPAPSVPSDFPSLSLTEIQNARGIMDVLAEMLNALEPGNKEGLRQDVIVDLVEQCRSYRQQVVQLANTTSDEELLRQGLALNDDLQRLLSKHDAIASGMVIRPEQKKPPPALLDIGDGSDAAQTSSKDVEQGSTSGSIINQPPLQQLLLPAPPGAAAAPATRADPNLDLLSGEDFQSPASKDVLALVSVGQSTASAPQLQPPQQQDMLALSDPFSHNSAIDSLGSQMTLPTSQAATQFQSLQQATIQEQQQAQSILYSNGSVPNIGELQQQQQMQPASYTNGTIPMTGAPQQFQHQMQPTLYPNGIIPTMGAPQQLQQQMQPTLYSNGTISSMGAPLQQQQQMQPGFFPNGSMPSMGPPQFEQAAYLQGVHMNQSHPAWGGQVAPIMNTQQQTFVYGSQSVGPLPPAPWDMQSMQSPQPLAFAYGQQAEVQFGDQRQATYSMATPDDISRRTQGLSLQDDRYTSSFQGSSAAYLQPKKPAKAEDKLFGDLVSIAKTKSKPSSTPAT
ncbi:TOM1-like protein 9 [Nymphaea colorata]|nr:TOM1-like protein 9 [Nymphaea colorata]